VVHHRFVVIDDGRPVAVTAHVDADGVRLPAESVRAALGWEVRPQGVCRGDVCVPLPGAADLDARGIELARLAEGLCRPLALDAAEGAAALAAPVEERRRALASLEAPDFTLPDLDGRPHRLRDQRGRKVMLVAYASW
jgi:hypothetical protein